MNRRLAFFDPEDHPDDTGHNPVAPDCRPTVDRLQRVLDGDEAASVLDADVHAQTCSTCRERVRAARMMASALANRDADAIPSAGLANAIVAAVAAERRSRRRRRWAFAAAGTAVAAGVLIALFANGNAPVRAPEPGRTPVVEGPKVPKQDPPPARLDEALADAGIALQNIGRQIARPPVEAPMVIAPIADALTQPPANPLAANLEPAARTLSELPDAALSSLEPVTDSATRALSRLLQDVTAVQPAAKPKS